MFMRITSSVEYAARLMVTLARSHGRARLSAERLSESENVPVGYANQILLRLKRAGLVESHRGAGGGYSLSRQPSEVSLGQVLRAVEGEIFEGVCRRYESGEKDCRHQESCALSPVWERLGVMIEGYFDSITLAGILEEQGSCGRTTVLFERMAAAKP